MQTWLLAATGKKRGKGQENEHTHYHTAASSYPNSNSLLPPRQRTPSMLRPLPRRPLEVTTFILELMCRGTNKPLASPAPAPGHNALDLV